MRRANLLSKSGAGLFGLAGPTGLSTLAMLFTGAIALLSPGTARAQTDPPPASSGTMLAPPTSGSLLAAPASQGESPHALALRARWVTLPGWALSPYLAAHTQLDDGWGVGLEYLYRRTSFDVVVSLDYSWLQAADGNFLGKSNNPATENHFTRFDKLSSLSADVSLIGHWNLTTWMEIRFGAGLGIGYVFGDIYQITNNSGCTADNAGDPTKCFPKTTGVVYPTTPDNVTKLENQRCSPDFTDGGRDTPVSPCYRKTDTYPFNVRVVPVLNVLLGLRFKLHPHVFLHLDGGFRLAGFYAGGGPEFRF